MHIGMYVVVMHHVIALSDGEPFGLFLDAGMDKRAKESLPAGDREVVQELWKTVTIDSSVKLCDLSISRIHRRTRT
jgi:hypothetical protein